MCWCARTSGPGTTVASCAWPSPARPSSASSRSPALTARSPPSQAGARPSRQRLTPRSPHRQPADSGSGHEMKCGLLDRRLAALRLLLEDLDDLLDGVALRLGQELEY